VLGTLLDSMKNSYSYNLILRMGQENTVWDPITSQRIATLHPLIISRVAEFINEADRLGIRLRITSAYRSFAEQDALFAQGRTQPGNIVTNACGGESIHNFGLAFDVVPMVNGQPDWNGNWSFIGTLGKSFGFTWGGDWQTFPDRPHFEMDVGLSLTELRGRLNKSELVGGFVQLG
jgi:hypothetical protein